MRDGRRSGISFALALLLLVTAAGFHGRALAQTPPQYLNSLQRSNYTVYAGDINGDGKTDILMKAKRRFVLIDFDIQIPIPIPSPSPTFVLLSNGTGPYTLNAAPDAATINNSAWQPNRYDLRYGDLLGNGAGGVIIEARNAGDPSFSVAAGSSNGQPSLIQALTPSAIDFDLGAVGVTTELADRNSDGRADLIIRQDGLIASVLLANASGVFTKDDESTLRAVWLGFRSYLDSNDALGALNYVSVEVVPIYSEVFNTLGSHLRDVGATWSDIRAVSIGASFATFTIIDSANSQQTLHYLVFVKENNRWVLASM